MENATQQLGRYVRTRRKLLRLSQRTVGQLTGKTQPQIARMERGEGNPSFDSASQVLRSLGVELVAVPVRLLPAVRHLIAAGEGTSLPGRTRLVGNNPESVTEERRDL